MPNIVKNDDNELIVNAPGRFHRALWASFVVLLICIVTARTITSDAALTGSRFGDALLLIALIAAGLFFSLILISKYTVVFNKQSKEITAFSSPFLNFNGKQIMFGEVAAIWVEFVVGPKGPNRFYVRLVGPRKKILIELGMFYFEKPALQFANYIGRAIATDVIYNPD